MKDYRAEKFFVTEYEVKKNEMKIQTILSLCRAGGTKIF